MRRGRMRSAGLFGAAIAIAGTLVAAAPAQAQEDGLALRPNALGNALKERVAKLDEELPNVGVTNVLADANRQAKHENGACNPDAGSLTNPPEVTESFCFDEGDSATTEWYPQGVTTVADAQQDQLWGATRPVLVSWYDHEADSTAKGVRVTFLDKNTGRYRHVLLVYPVINSYGNASYESVRTDQDNGTSLHAGGIVWYGNFLYVADTERGFRVFDMRHIYDLGEASNGSTDDPDKIGRHDGTYYAHGYRYVMPQVASWTADSSPMHFSFTSLDRTAKDSIIAGEYCDSGGKYCDGKTKGTVAAWQAAGAVDGSGEQITDANYRWKPTETHTMQVTNIQGAARDNGFWYLSQSKGSDSNGILHKTVQNPSGDLTSNTSQPLAIGPEDLSVWRGQATAIWTVGEHPGKRMLYSVSG